MERVILAYHSAKEKTNKEKTTTTQKNAVAKNSAFRRWGVGLQFLQRLRRRCNKFFKRA